MPLLLIPYGVAGAISPPVVTTQSPTSITQTTAIFNGTVTNGGGASITEHGFQYGTTPNPDDLINTTGSSLGTGAFAQAPISLIPGQVYYCRAYAINAAGIGFGAWVSFTMLEATYSITINGIDRTADVLNKQTTITDQITQQQNTMTFQMVDRRGLGVPSTDQEIIITLNNATRIFAGYLTKITQEEVKGSYVLYQIDCMDYVRLLDRNLVNKTYNNMTDAAIIEDIITTYCPGFGITANNVIAGVTLDQITFNYVQPSQALRKIADLTGRNWYIDYNKDIHYFPISTNPAPFNISDSQTFASGKGYFNTQISTDASQLKNRVYVRGGTSLSNSTTFSKKGDGTTKKHLIPDKPHSVTVKVNGVVQSLGIKNIDLSGFSYYLNFDEKYVEQDAALTALSSTDVLEVDYSYDIPILVAVENTTSIDENGVHEFAIFDSKIATTVAARARAAAELIDYANNLIEGQFETYTDGFRSGQYINVNSTILGITNTNYIVQKVTSDNLGAGVYHYTVYIASAKTMGIIRFLVELLEQANNSVQVGTNEVLDNLLTLSDSLDPNSLTDLLTTDSAGPYATWCTDSLQATPTTRARWNLFQWG